MREVPGSIPGIPQRSKQNLFGYFDRFAGVKSGLQVDYGQNYGQNYDHNGQDTWAGRRLNTLFVVPMLVWNPHFILCKENTKL